MYRENKKLFLYVCDRTSRLFFVLPLSVLLRRSHIVFLWEPLGWYLSVLELHIFLLTKHIPVIATIHRGVHSEKSHNGYFPAFTFVFAYRDRIAKVKCNGVITIVVLLLVIIWKFLFVWRFVAGGFSVVFLGADCLFKKLYLYISACMSNYTLYYCF